MSGTQIFYVKKMELGELTDEIRCVLLEAQSSVVSFLLDELLEIK